ncbi:hypothetical protein [Saccharopolyspora spinosa]|nr:hypothetical protein [Saccharopolyspora spinosa]
MRLRLKAFEDKCAAVCDIKCWPNGSNDLLANVQHGELAMTLAHLPVHAEGIKVFELVREPLGAVLQRWSSVPAARSRSPNWSTTPTSAQRH